MQTHKKFDVVLMNPPYAQSGDAKHLKFVYKCIEIAHEQVSVFPFAFILNVGIKRQDTYRKNIDKYIVSVDEIKSSDFKGTSMSNTAIYHLSKNQHNDITINFVNGKHVHLKSLFDLSRFNDYEKQIVSYLEKQGRYPHIIVGPYHTKRRYLSGDDIEQQVYNETKYNAIKNIPDNKVYLICNSVNGAMNGTFFSGKVGQIICGFNDLIDYFVQTDVVTPHTIIMFDNIKQAENCKRAMNNALLRMTVYKTQTRQRMTIKTCYKYIPNIDWSNDKCCTDIGLLEMCGCEHVLAIEYSHYVAQLISDVDKNKFQHNS